MKKIVKLVFLLSFSLFISNCHSGGEHPGERSHEVGAADHDHEHSDGEIHLDEHRALELGVGVSVVETTEIHNVTEVTGEVIADSSASGAIVAPAAGEVVFRNSLVRGSNVEKGQTIASISTSRMSGGDPLEAARINLEATRREVERLKPLREEGIVTVGEYNAALAAYEQAKNAASTAGRTVAVPLSGVISSVEVSNGQFVEAGTVIATVAAGEGSLLVRADIPKRHSDIISTIKSALIVDPHHGETVEGTMASAPSAALASAGYVPVYFSLPSDTDMAPGCFVDVFLSSGDSRPGIMIPVDAITDRMGTKFVYVRLDEDCYERRPVEVGTIDGNLIEIVDGLRPGEEVVTEGVTFVRLAENSNTAVPGHTHNH